MVKNNTIVIDAGTTKVGGKIMGDVNFESLKNKVKYITPSRGGIGPVTVAKLLENVVKLSKEKLNNDTKNNFKI